MVVRRSPCTTRMTGAWNVVPAKPKPTSPRLSMTGIVHHALSAATSPCALVLNVATSVSPRTFCSARAGPSCSTHHGARMPPTLILLVGMATILAGIVLLRLNAFLALIIAAIVVSLLAPGEPAVKIARVAEGFGRTAGTVGIVVPLPAAGAGLLFAGWVDRRMPVVPQRPAALAVGASAVTAPAPQQLPGLVPSILPIILPVLLISSHTVVVSMTARPGLHVAMWSALAPYTAVIGNPNLALLVGTGIAMWVYARQRTASRADLAEMVETSLMSAGVMILIIAARGGFGVALQATGIGSVIERAFVGQSGGAASGTDSGMVFLFLGFGVASLIKLAQGSSTVAMITTAAMLAAMLPASGLPFHTVYVATAIASGSLVGTWMNDSGFWLFSKMGGVTEIETLKSWTPVLAIVGVTAMVTTLALALLVPLR